MLNSSEKFALILIPPFLVGLTNFYDKGLTNFYDRKSLQGIEPMTIMTICLCFTAIATMPLLFFVEILLLRKMKYMTKTFFLKPQPL
jgi:hypothetical protein